MWHRRVEHESTKLRKHEKRRFPLGFHPIEIRDFVFSVFRVFVLTLFHHDGHRSRDGRPLRGHSSLNFESISFSIAATALSASSPLARTRSVEPASAASIMRPKMLLPFTSWPSFTIVMSAV